MLYSAVLKRKGINGYHGVIYRLQLCEVDRLTHNGAGVATNDLLNDVIMSNESMTCTVGRMIVREVGIA